MKNIFGSIGYTLLNNKHNILIFADKHDNIPDCENKINMAEWFKTKFDSSIILLEEIPRVNHKLMELWNQSSHTQELKNIYLHNPSIIKPVDIRHFLLPYSWEIIDKNDKAYNISLLEYIKEINIFFIMENEYLIKNCPLYDVNKLQTIMLGRHFLNIKNEYKKLLHKCTRLDLLNKDIIYVLNNNKELLYEINELISNIMEWYICACINQHIDRSLIIHVGLAHSEQIVNSLKTIYNYNIVEEQGINKLVELDTKKLKGCVQISKEIDEQFGGYL